MELEKNNVHDLFWDAMGNQRVETRWRSCR